MIKQSFNKACTPNPVLKEQGEYFYILITDERKLAVREELVGIMLNVFSLCCTLCILFFILASVAFQHLISHVQAWFDQFMWEKQVIYRATRQPNKLLGTCGLWGNSICYIRSYSSNCWQRLQGLQLRKISLYPCPLKNHRKLYNVPKNKINRIVIKHGVPWCLKPAKSPLGNQKCLKCHFLWLRKKHKRI